MRNSTSAPLKYLFNQKVFIKTLATLLLFVTAANSFAQNNPGFVPMYVPNPTGIVNPANPTGAPEQFTTNLVAVNSTGNITVDGNIAVLDNSFSNAVDNNDAPKIINNPGENFGLVRNNTDLVIEARQLVTTSDTLFYKMTNLKTQDYQLQFFPINMNKPGLSAVLVDRYLLTRTAVSLTVAPSYYPFTVTADPGSFAQDRFILVLTQSEAGPLPVNFISIAANQSANGIQLSWKVGFERGIQNYSIERSTDGRNFNNIGSIAAFGYTDNEKVYSWKDAAVLSGTQFYRIKSNGVGGEIKYSPVARISFGSIKSSIAVSPNPVAGSIMNLQLTKIPKGRYDLNLLGMDGKLIYQNYVQHTGENATFPIALPSVVSKGTYILNVISPDKTRQSQVLVIE